jgi:hypothetical protein
LASPRIDYQIRLRDARERLQSEEEELMDRNDFDMRNIYGKAIRILWQTMQIIVMIKRAQVMCDIIVHNTITLLGLSASVA